MPLTWRWPYLFAFRVNPTQSWRHCELITFKSNWRWSEWDKLVFKTIFKLEKIFTELIIAIIFMAGIHSRLAITYDRGNQWNFIVGDSITSDYRLLSLTVRSPCVEDTFYSQRGAKIFPCFPVFLSSRVFPPYSAFVNHIFVIGSILISDQPCTKILSFMLLLSARAKEPRKLFSIELTILLSKTNTYAHWWLINMQVQIL